LTNPDWSDRMAMVQRVAYMFERPATQGVGSILCPRVVALWVRSLNQSLSRHEGAFLMKRIGSAVWYVLKLVLGFVAYPFVVIGLFLFIPIAAMWCILRFIYRKIQA